eukprot:CAMPEP_0171754284 /NCGR_PEP_ID=MMETSP0991-20121206/43734_1 /TAXON_ID=483369 /ORGANISM="non described non described, Strain CCMP2098" /LENGTH=75 /DNA_ID=CAMNT_0012356057 /DNA_START=57 /DNA_END=281 /DNA_ORIENTATION=+
MRARRTKDEHGHSHTGGSHRGHPRTSNTLEWACHLAVLRRPGGWVIGHLPKGKRALSLRTSRRTSTRRAAQMAKN